MKTSSGSPALLIILAGASAALALLFPLATRAQATPQSELDATIRAELLSDPRTSSLSSAQLDTMVDLLSQEAQKQGLTVHDITWRPQASPPDALLAEPPESCTDNVTCVFDEAFGFVGPDTTIPFALGAGSMGLVWLLAEMLHRRKYPHLFT